MKKIFLSVLALFCLVCTACTQSPQEQNTPLKSETALAPQAPHETDLIPEQDLESSGVPLLENYLTKPDIPKTPVREYGESRSHLRMKDGFVARLLYPVGNLEQLDAAVESWIQETASYYQAKSSNNNTSADSSELTVDYSSYLINDSLVSVKLSGIYDHPHLAHPIDISASFNASKTTGKLLTIDDLLLPDSKETLRDMVIKDAGVEADAADDNILRHWLLTPDGLEITLVRGDYLPMSAGTVTLLYSYESLDGIFSLSDFTLQQAAVPDPSKPMLALTFDDGPSDYTEQLLDTFAAHGGKGTFFVVGNMLDGQEAILQRMAAEGHEIGSHSWNHRQLTTLSVDELTDQFMSTRAKIYEITGMDSILLRPPYGSCNKQVRAKAAELGVVLITWSVDTLDWKYPDPDTVYQAIMTGAADGAILLCHDLHKSTVDAMERAIPALIAEGYQLVTVTELLTSDGGTMTPGELYRNR